MTLLTFDRVQKRYQAGIEEIRALDDVSLTIAGGELVALLGPSGSGKTTLLKIAAGILAPDAGDVRYAGRSLAGLKRREQAVLLREEIGMVSQTWQLHGGLSAIDNVTVPLLAAGMSPRAARRRVVPLLERVGLGGRVDHFPHELSTGEQQRVSIACALAREPRLILADEPTGNLDRTNGAGVLKMLADAAEDGAAVMLVTHDQAATAIAHRTVRLTDGRLRTEQPAGDRDIAETR